MQTAKRLLGGRKIAALQGARQILVGRIGLAVLAKGLVRRGLRIGRRPAGQRFLKGCQCSLGRREVARFQGTADGLEIFGDLGESVLVGGRARIGGRIYAGDGAHIDFII